MQARPLSEIIKPLQICSEASKNPLPKIPHNFFFPQDTQEGKNLMSAIWALFEMFFEHKFHLRTQATTTNFVANDIQEYFLTKCLIWKFHRNTLSDSEDGQRNFAPGISALAHGSSDNSDRLGPLSIMYLTLVPQNRVDNLHVRDEQLRFAPILHGHL
jgi:hypothetical protein